MKYRKPSLMIAILAALLFAGSPFAYAANCQTGAKVASDLWKTYDDEAKKVGCVLGTGAAVIATGGMKLPEAAKIYSECLQKTDKADQIARNVIQQWNDLVNNNWATIGPRKLEMNSTQTGTIRSQGTRMFVTPTPVSDALEIAITKERFRGKTRVTVCKYSPSGPGLNANGDKIWEFTVDKGLGNKGKTWRRQFGDVAGHIVSVSLKGQSLVKSMKYSVTAKPLTTVIVNGGEKSGGTDYTIKVSGSIKQISGSLNGINVTIQGNDHVSGNTANGAVGAGIDGFIVDGQIRDIQLSNANGANVYVGGQRYNAGGGGAYVTIEPDTNRAGSDYDNFDLPKADPNLCADACEKDRKCRAYTYVKPGVQGNNARCWLKDSVPSASRSNCCVSGVKNSPLPQEFNANLPGSDYDNFDLSSADPSLCADACAKDSRCKAYTYVKPGYQGNNARCWLKDSVPRKTTDDCCVSGVK